MKQRNILLDYLRGLAIFLVIWGHSIQFATEPTYDFFADKAFILIYTFHMPIFGILSGYLFFPTYNKKTFKEIVVGKTKQILIPLLLWGAIRMLADGLVSFKNGKGLGLITFNHYVDYVTTALWFLWTAYVSSIISAVIRKLLGDKLWVYAAATVLVLLLPNAESFYMVKYMLPYFFAGNLYHKYMARLQPLANPAFYASLILFPLLLLKWNSYVYIYNSGAAFNILGSASGIAVILYRYALGFIGSILFIVLVEKFVFPIAQKAIVNIGQQTLGIYILGGFIAIFGLRHLHLPTTPSWFYSFVLTPLLSVGVTALSYWLTVLLSKSPLLNEYLLGGRSIGPQASVPVAAQTAQQNV